MRLDKLSAEREAGNLNDSGMTVMIIPEGFALRQPGNPSHKNNDDRRPMALRHYLSVILRFGKLVDPDRQTCTPVLDSELCAAVF